MPAPCQCHARQVSAHKFAGHCKAKTARQSSLQAVSSLPVSSGGLTHLHSLYCMQLCSGLCCCMSAFLLISYHGFCCASHMPALAMQAVEARPVEQDSHSRVHSSNGASTSDRGSLAERVRADFPILDQQSRQSRPPDGRGAPAPPPTGVLKVWASFKCHL